MEKPKIGIVGGGLSGASLAFFLREKYDVTVIEREKEAGGLLRSVNTDGYTFDIGGSHIIFSKDQETLKRMLSLLGKNYVKRKRNTKILYNGRLVKYPFENGLCDLPFLERMECGFDFLIQRVKNLLAEEPKNFKDWCYHQFGDGIAKKYLIPYNEKIWKFPLDEISTTWVDRVPSPPITDILKSMLGFETEGYTHQLYFYYPEKGGIQAFFDSIVKNVGRTRVKTGVEVYKVDKEDGRWVLRSNKGDFVFDNVVFTIPLPELARIRGIPRTLKKHVSKLAFNSLTTVGVGLKTKLNHNLSWVYIPDKDILPHRVCFLSNYSRKNAPNGCSSILAEITTREKLPRNIEELVTEDLDTLGIIQKKDVDKTVVFSFKYAYVVNTFESEIATKSIKEILESYGVKVFGRFGRWDYANMDEIFRTAEEYARNL